jgi:SRSO17 transposase
VRLPAEQRVRANKWRKFERIFSDGSREVRYIREIIYGKKRELRYWEITTNIETLPENSTWYVMTQIPGVLAKEVGNLYGNRTWIEYGFRQSKSELGWADFRVTQYSQIEKWWEIVCSAYLMIGLYTRSHTAVNSRTSLPNISSAKNCPIFHRFEQHQDWNEKNSWKSHLNNLRLILQPLISFNLMQQWLKVFPIPQLSTGLARLRALMNFYPNPFSCLMNESEFLFSSAA